MSGQSIGNAIRVDSEDSAAPFDVEAVRRDFPILSTEVYGKPLVYLDNAATTQKPSAVIQAIVQYYETENANIHRGVHHLSQLATEAYEGSRSAVQRFLNASSPREVVFVRGATEGINLVAQTYVRERLNREDEVLVTTMEHHSNIVPWQMLCQQTGASLRVLPMNDRGELLLDRLPDFLTERLKFVSLVHVSNALGTVNPVAEVIAQAHSRGIPVLVDAAQSAPHLALDVQSLDADFLVFSGHKVYGPTGIGVVFGKERHLEGMPPYQGGGDMISSVTFEKTTYNEIPFKFEAGTPNIAGAVGLGAALGYIRKLGLKRIETYEAALLKYADEALRTLPEVRLVGQAANRASVSSFVVAGVHPHDLGTILDRMGVAIRTGHHCAQPVMDFYGIPATARASFSFYNRAEEVDLLVCGLKKALELFA